MTGSTISSYDSKHIEASFPYPAVLLLSFNRPPVNAINDEVWAEIGRHANTASTDPEVRCIVLASSLDRAFTAGLDLSQSSLGKYDGGDPGRTALMLKDHIQSLQRTVSALAECSKPVIAAVHGYAFGGAIDIASACDIRYAATSSVFSIKEVDVGLAADVGSLQRLPRRTGNDSLLRELALTARNFGVEEAVKLGLVSKVVKGGRAEVLKAAMETAQVIASKSPVAVVGTKHVLNYSEDHTVQEGLDYTAIWNMSMLQSDDLKVAMQAFKTKKPPTFAKLSKL